MNLINSIKRKLRHQYFFNTKKTKGYWYDDEKCKYVRDKRDDIKAKDTLYCWWNGEDDIFDVVLLKIEQMFYEMKKNGHHSYCYLWAHLFENACKSDKDWTLSYILKQLKNNRKFAFNNSTKDSASGLAHYYLSDEKGLYKLSVEVDEQLDPNIIPKHKKMYTLEGFDDIKGKLITKEAPQYKTCLHSTIYECDTIDEMIRFVKVEFKKDLVDELIKNEQTFELEMSDYKVLSKPLLKQVDGLREQLKDLLQLRHLIKKARYIEDPYPFELPEYKDVWDTLTFERKTEIYQALQKKHLKDRQNAYRAIADFMALKGNTWWD